MADEARAPDPRTPPPPPDPRRGNVRVSGAPNRPPMLPWSPRRFITILIALFVLNWLLVAVFAPPENKIKVPYNPTFLNQVRAGNVEEISASGNTVKGDFKKDVSYKGDKAKRFETEVPIFANRQQLSSLLETNNVVITAEPPGERSLLETLLFSFGPTILLVALFVWFARRAAGAAGGGGVLGQFGRSRARRVESATQDVSFKDVAGIEEAEQELAERVDSDLARGACTQPEPGQGACGVERRAASAQADLVDELERSSRGKALDRPCDHIGDENPEADDVERFDRHQATS